MKTYILILISFGLLACGQRKDDQDFEAPYPCYETVTEDDNRPNILVIGDSISIGYTPFLQSSLQDYEVTHNLCNAMSSKSGVRHIDEWLNQRHEWDAITFNHGLWDIANWINVSPNEYRKNLREVAIKVKASAPVVVFVLTSEVLPATKGRSDEKVRAYNEIAKEVMAELDIPVFDMHSVSAQIPELHVAPDDVHFTDEGSEFLGNSLSDFLKEKLNELFEDAR